MVFGDKRSDRDGSVQRLRHLPIGKRRLANAERANARRKSSSTGRRLRSPAAPDDAVVICETSWKSNASPQQAADITARLAKAGRQGPLLRSQAITSLQERRCHLLQHRGAEMVPADDAGVTLAHATRLR